MQDSDEPTTQGMLARMEAYIAAASENIDPSNIDQIDELSKKFLDTLSPKSLFNNS